MNLFELFAKLTLDVTEFDQGVKDAVEKSGEIQKAVENVDTSSIDDEIKQLEQDIAARDREIADLDDQISKLEMANVDDQINKSDKEIEKLKKSMESADQKAAVTQGIIQGLTSSAVDMTKDAINAIIQFCGESLDYVAASGTEAGKQLKSSMDNMEITMEALKMKVGTALAPVAASFYDLAASLTGVTQEEKILILLRKLDSYTFENIKQVRKDLDGIFKGFEQYKPPEADKRLNASDMIAGLQSQATFFTEYDRVMKSLQEKGVSTDILAKYADGSQESFNQLQAMDKASEAEIIALNEAYAALEEAKTNAAETISDAQLQVDETVDDLITSIAKIATEVNTENAGNNVFDMAQGIIDSLQGQYPSISKWVNTINNKIGSLGTSMHLSPSIGGQLGLAWHGGGVGYANGFSTGMDYVPYNNYVARLHEGEAVLTKAEASAWRRGDEQGAAVGIDYGRLGQAVAGAMAGMSVQMDGQAVGVLVTGAVSREMGRRVKARQYTG